jgi:transcriptional regulator with XRE-family HTH domain
MLVSHDRLQTLDGLSQAPSNYAFRDSAVWLHAASSAAALHRFGGEPMVDLKATFGQLVAAHRRRLKLTQDQLAEKADLSVDMIGKIETGSSGASFAAIEKLAKALGVSPAELFTRNVPDGALKSPALDDLTNRLARLSEPDLKWIARVFDAAMGRGRGRSA